MSEAIKDHIVINPEICGGRPTIRGTRIRASDVLDMLASGATQTDILADFDELKPEDIQAAIQFAARSIGHPVLKVA
ncbi:MAG: DUF433 domain-containing protein [Beijerinckiaceae bacterium]